MTSQTELYQQVILEHNRRPRNFGKLPAATHSAEGFNPLCGDHLWVYLTIRAAQSTPDSGGESDSQAMVATNDPAQAVIEAVTFEGSGCAISKASASMMTQALRGLTVAQAHALFGAFQGLLKGENADAAAADQSAEVLGKLKIFSGIWHFPARVKCAALAWHALEGALNAQQTVSTE